MERAHQPARALLSAHDPGYIEPATDAALHEPYPTRPQGDVMRAAWGR